MPLTKKECATCGHPFFTSRKKVIECHNCQKGRWRSKRVIAERSAPGRHTAAEWADVIDKQRGCCYYCAKWLFSPSEMFQGHKDHKVPLSRGGSKSKSNLAAACSACNFEKGNMTAEEYMSSHPERSHLVVHMLELPTYKEPVFWDDFNSPPKVGDSLELLPDLRREDERTSWAWKHPPPKQVDPPNSQLPFSALEIYRRVLSGDR